MHEVRPERPRPHRHDRREDLLPQRAERAGRRQQRREGRREGRARRYRGGDNGGGVEPDPAVPAVLARRDRVLRGSGQHELRGPVQRVRLRHFVQQEEEHYHHGDLHPGGGAAAVRGVVLLQEEEGEGLGRRPGGVVGTANLNLLVPRLLYCV